MSRTDNESKLLNWLNANGLSVPRDFKFAFTSELKAAKACPEAPMAAAEARKAISSNIKVEVLSSWTLWTQNADAELCQEPSQQHACQLGSGEACAHGETVQTKVQQTTASGGSPPLRMLCTSLSLGDLPLSGARRTRLDDSWFRLQITRIAATEARTILSAMRTWKHWGAWCYAHEEDFLRPSASAPALFLYAASAATRATERPRTLPTTRFNHM